MRAPALDLEARTDAGELVAKDRGGLVEDRRSGAGKRGEHERGTTGPELGDPDDPGALPDEPQARIEMGSLHGKGDHLDGGGEAPWVHHRLRGKCRQGELLADRVHRGDSRLVDAEHPAHRGEKIAAIGERSPGDEPDAICGTGLRAGGRAGKCFRELPRRLVLGDIVRVQARRHHRVVACAAERRDIFGRKPLALLEDPPGKPEPVGENRGFRVGEGSRTEAHLGSGGYRVSAGGASRSLAVISAVTAAAISAGDLAPIASPMGP